MWEKLRQRLDFWYQTCSKPGIRPKTQQCYENRIYNHIIPSVGDIPLKKLRQTDLQKFYQRLKTDGRVQEREQRGTGLSDSSVRGCHITCRAALQKAVTENLLVHNPAQGCKLPPKKAGEMQVLTQEEMVRFLIQAKEDDFYELALLELSTGMRRGEICGLKWTDLNFRTGELHISRQAARLNGKVQTFPLKTKSSHRTILLPPAVLQVLQERKQNMDSRWIFPSPVVPDTPIDPATSYRAMKRILNRAQCKEIRFHDLRYTVATTALENGMDIKTLSTVIGHVSAGTTIDVYSHITEPMLPNAARKIDKGIGTVSSGEPTETVCLEQGSSNREKPKFTAQKGKIRKPGTGGVYQINDHLYEGRYTPTNAQGKREVHTVYAQTEDACEEKLSAMIREVKEKIKAEKGKRKENGSV